ncbi:hypothetical protein N7524_008699 [Penicillium chrysogenum]|nr:hypothetical protein N7524_008699 [Penicillium chrysogenum]
MVIALDIDYRTLKSKFYRLATGLPQSEWCEGASRKGYDRSRGGDGKYLCENSHQRSCRKAGDMDQVISTFVSTLCDFLSSAESGQRVQTQQAGVVNRIDPGTLKRRRPPNAHRRT